MENKIYTKSGDLGETSDGNKRVSKSDCNIDSFGDIDELNSFIGMHKQEFKDPILRELNIIQKDLLALGASLSGSQSDFTPEKVKEIEGKIDRYNETMPPLKQFIIPSGSLHMARAICRRAERSLVRLSKQQSVDPEILAYMNRLSDFLFVLARYSNNLKGLPESIWE